LAKKGWWGGEAQSVGPEFKPQCRKKKRMGLEDFKLENFACNSQKERLLTYNHITWIKYPNIYLSKPLYCTGSLKKVLAHYSFL
jgi:hypothetical protein